VSTHSPARSGARRARLAAPLVAAAVALASLGACHPDLDRAAYDHHVYDRPLPAFVAWWLAEHAAATGRSPAAVRRDFDRRLAALDDPRAANGRWDLSTDGCSSAPDTGPSFDFRAACVRHDFAWRNLKRLDRRWGVGRFDTRAARLRANGRFHADLLTDCARRSGPAASTCRGAAALYKAAVDLAA